MTAQPHADFAAEPRDRVVLPFPCDATSRGDATPAATTDTTPDATPDASGALSRALGHLERTQWERGCWAGEVVWSTMLLSQYVIVAHITGQPIEPARRERFLRYYRAWQRSDGGFGLHAESHSYVFMTALAYVALRLLGLRPVDEMPRRAREWLRANGDALAIPSWGKMWLAMLGLYGWEGVNPIQPELWLLPAWAPLHPRRLYSHTRMIYLGLGYLYGRRLVAAPAPIRDQLRAELYDRPYESIDFRRYRHEIAATDVYAPPSPTLRLAYDLLGSLERHHSRRLRGRALDVCFDHMLYELRTTRYACVSPVNGLLFTLALWDRRHPETEQAFRGVDYWSWRDEAEGERFNGAHSHTWDTAFIVQAISDGPASSARRMDRSLARASAYLDAAQMRTELPERERYFRDPRAGGYCFSDEHHQWPVSDCTAEAMSAILAMEPRLAPAQRISRDRLRQAARFVLSRQNADGGWGSYERSRGSRLLERLNPSEMFGNCMVEGSYVECTASCVAGLARFRDRYPGELAAPIERAVARGVAFVRRAQRSDGSWEGFWGVNFTYAIMYACEGLVAAGVPPGDPALARARAWLREKQKPDGGWGEHYTSCLRREYVEHPASQVIMTAWAVMALLAGGAPTEADRGAAARGVRLLALRQNADGSFPKEGVGGVFFNTAMHHYELYRDTFTTWALARWERLLGSPAAPAM